MVPQLRRVTLQFVNTLLFILEGVRRRLVRPEFNRATEQDVYYGYRLFYNRPPDEEGHKAYMNMINTHAVTIEFLRDSFLDSEELHIIREKRDAPVLVALPDFNIYVRLNDYFFGAAIANQRIYEAHVTETLRELLRPGHTFLDIGANIGYFSMLAAAHLDNSGRVIAFEPFERNRQLFMESVRANDFRNVDLFPYAVADTERTFALDVASKDSNSRVIDVEEAAENKPRVKAVPLDTFLSDLAALDVVKIDIEGAEPLALKGMRSLLEKHRPYIITEFSPSLLPQTSQTQPIEYLKQLTDLGYALCIIHPTGGRSEPMTPRQVLDYFEHRPGITHLDLLATPA